jgi:hypothetical protein
MSCSMIGPFVEIAGDVMRRRADQLHPALMRLVVGLRALEPGQEGMVDVDAAPRQMLRHLLRQDLHVAGEHDEIDRARLDRCARSFASCSASSSPSIDRQVVERDVAEIGRGSGRCSRGIVGDDARRSPSFSSPM